MRDGTGSVLPLRRPTASNWLPPQLRQGRGSVPGACPWGLFRAPPPRCKDELGRVILGSSRQGLPGVTPSAVYGIWTLVQMGTDS
jgi:hypothetical protein